MADIGFTMALFVADLAFPEAGEAALLTAAKLGILVASLIAGVGGWLILARVSSIKAAESGHGGVANEPY